jgi:hypothetical protein
MVTTMSKYSSDGGWLGGAMILITFVLFTIISGVIFVSTQDTVSSALVQEKERVMKEDSSKYLIYTVSEVFENTDTIFAFKFNSSDLYGRIKEGCLYTFGVYGLRVPFLSMYRNITQVSNERCE